MFGRDLSLSSVRLRRQTRAGVKNASPPMVRTLSLLVLSLFALACRTVPVPPGEGRAPEGPVKLSLLATTDIHGWVHTRQESLGGGHSVTFGGLPLLSEYLKVFRKENPGGVLLFDAGDLFQGTLISNLTEGAVVVDAMNALGYDAAAIGNHEFDYGPVGPLPTARTPDQDSFGALKARIAQAHFPLLSTNIYEKANARRPPWLPLDGTLILERKGVKVGVFGLTTPQTPMTTMPINVDTLKFSSLAHEALTAARQLRKRGADVVVALVHAGGHCDDWKDPHNLSSCDTSTGEIFEMLRGLPENTLDAVVAGHTHAVVGHYFNGVPVVENPGLGRYLTLLELWWDPVARRVLSDRTVMNPAVPVCGTVDESTGSCDVKVLKSRPQVNMVPASIHGVPVSPDPAIEALLKPALELVSAQQKKPLGASAPVALTRDYEGESPLGSFLSDSLRAAESADIALLNPGGLRADLRAGPLTYGDVYEVLPFDNSVATLTLSAPDVRKLLEAAFSSRKGVFQVSGIELLISRCPSRRRLKDVTLPGGKALDSKSSYRVVMPDFLARGGDGLGPFLATVDPSRIDFGASRGLSFRDTLVEFWAHQKPAFVAPKPGRVKFAPDDGDCAETTPPGPRPNSP